jgi:hypothetical protein
MSDDIVAELDRWLAETVNEIYGPTPVMVQRARDEIVALRKAMYEMLTPPSNAARAAQRERDEEIALRYAGESYVAELIANAIHNQGDES